MSNMDISSLLSMLLSQSEQEQAEQTENENTREDESKEDNQPGIDFEMLLKIGEIISRLNESDKNTELLLALKPHLREENRARIDTAVRLFKLISLLPYLKESGMFDNLL